MKCTDKEWDTCQVEKMGCPGCYYDKIEIDEYIRNKAGYIAKARKIKFVGLDEAYFIKNAINTAVAEVIKKENISLIGINKSIEVPINLDEVIKQLTERFNININLDEALNKTATQLQQEYNNQYLGRW